MDNPWERAWVGGFVDRAVERQLQVDTTSAATDDTAGFSRHTADGTLDQLGASNQTTCAAVISSLSDTDPSRSAGVESSTVMMVESQRCDAAGPAKDAARSTGTSHLAQGDPTSGHWAI